MEDKQKINLLDLERLEVDFNGIDEAMTWGVGPLKALTSALYDLHFGIAGPSQEEQAQRNTYILTFMEEQLNRLEKYLDRVRETLMREEKTKR